MHIRHALESLAAPLPGRAVHVAREVLDKIREIVARIRCGGDDVGFESLGMDGDARRAFLDLLAREGDAYQLLMIGEPQALQGVLLDQSVVGTVAERLMAADLTVAVINLSDGSGYVCDASDEGGQERVFDLTTWGSLGERLAPIAATFDGRIYHRRGGSPGGGAVR